MEECRVELQRLKSTDPAACQGIRLRTARLECRDENRQHVRLPSSVERLRASFPKCEHMDVETCT